MRERHELRAAAAAHHSTPLFSMSVRLTVRYLLSRTNSAQTKRRNEVSQDQGVQSFLANRNKLGGEKYQIKGKETQGRGEKSCLDT